MIVCFYVLLGLFWNGVLFRIWFGAVGCLLLDLFVLCWVLLGVGHLMWFTALCAFVVGFLIALMHLLVLIGFAFCGLLVWSVVVYFMVLLCIIVLVLDCECFDCVVALRDLWFVIDWFLNFELVGALLGCLIDSCGFAWVLYMLESFGFERLFAWLSFRYLVVYWIVWDVLVGLCLRTCGLMCELCLVWYCGWKLLGV